MRDTGGKKSDAGQLFAAYDFLGAQADLAVEIVSNLTKIRSTEIIQAPPKEIESIGNIDANIVAKREGIQCIISDKSANIDDYVLFMPHGDYPNIEKLIDFLMTTLTNGEEAKAIVFAPNVTKTGINSFVTKENLVVIQNFC